MSAFTYEAVAKVLETAEPITYHGPWNVIKDWLIKAGEVVESGGVIQKVVSVGGAASEAATAGEVSSAVCAMEVSEAVVAGETVTTLTPAAAIVWTPKSVVAVAIAAVVGLEIGYYLQNNIQRLFEGEEWQWIPTSGLVLGEESLVRTFITKDGSTYYDEETVQAFAARWNEIGAFSESFEPEQVVRGDKVNFLKNLYYNPFDTLLAGVANVNVALELCAQYLMSEHNLTSDFAVKTPTYVTIMRYSDSDIRIGLSTIFVNSSPVKYLYGEDIYVSSSTSDTDLINFNDVLSSNLGNRLNNWSGAAVHFNIPSLSDKLYSAAAFFITTDMGQTWRYSSGSSGGGLREILFSYSTSPMIHSYFPLGTLEGVPGVQEQEGATIPSSFPVDIPETYPTWQPNIVVNPEGDVITYPVGLPNTADPAKPATRPQSQAQEGVNELPAEAEAIEEAITSSPQIAEDIGLDTTVDTPVEDIGDLPVAPIPSVGIPGTGFVAIYNPTQSQLASFSRFLWSNDFIDNIKKLFEDPMQAIIGLHMIYATPSRGADHNIICGYLDSEVTSRTVSSQYINIACGAIKINKYFGNILDYAPYTKIQLFLPFIGVVNLDTNEVMGSTLNVTYRVDVLTGACLAQVSVSRSDYGAVMYTFSGNCAVQLPITGGNYSSIIANTIGIGASVGATIASGGALAPVAVAGAAAGVSNSHLSVAHSGSIGANAGAMGGKIPYLIITRPKPYTANNYNNFYGYPSNKTVKLSSCSGFTRVKDIHIEGINATNDELSNIENLLKEGVII